MYPDGGGGKPGWALAMLGGCMLGGCMPAGGMPGGGPGHDGYAPYGADGLGPIWCANGCCAAGSA
jgi:hypothetical protein